MYLRPFDPWKNQFCTCPPKFSLNPYTGCLHGCLYCYASSYIKDFHVLREKPDLIKRLKREIERIPSDSLISLSNTSDPYPSVEAQRKITRETLKIFRERGLRVLIITKSPLVTRDIDILKDMKCAVTITVTSLKHFRRLEPNAPSPFDRLKALETLSKNRIKTGLRFDPIIPFINQEEAEKVINQAKSTGVSHITASTFKPRWDSWKRILIAFPELRNDLESIYLREGERIGNSIYLKEDLRIKLLSQVRDICNSLGLTFATCRENLPDISNSQSCDGSHLIS